MPPCLTDAERKKVQTNIRTFSHSYLHIPEIEIK